MSRGSLVRGFLIASFSRSIGNGLFPLLPRYVAHLGVAPDLIGYYLAVRQASWKEVLKSEREAAGRV